MSESRSDYVYQGDTWWIVEPTCPDCGAIIASNGKIHDCKQCEWWEVKEELQR